MDDIKQRLLDALNKATDVEARPGDETALAQNPRNALIEALGMPQKWKQTVAEDKQSLKDLPMNMAMGTMGTVGSTEGLAGQALNKLQMAQQAGKPMSTAEQYLLNKAMGKGVTVVPTAQEQAFAKLKGMMGK